MKPTLSKSELINSAINLCTPKEICVQYGFKEQTLAKQRLEKKGPPYIKNGRSVFYIEHIFKQWMADNLVGCDYKLID